MDINDNTYKEMFKDGEFISNKQMVEIFGIQNGIDYYNKTKSLGSYKAQIIKKMSRYFEFDIIKGGVKITKILDKPFIYNKRVSNFKQYNVAVSDDKLFGVYKIETTNDIYIGSTCQGFRSRFYGYVKKNKKGYCGGDYLLDNSGVFSILWKTDNNDEFVIREKEIEYINYYLNNSDKNIVNKIESVNVLNTKSNNKTICILKEDYDRVVKFLLDNSIRFI